MKPLGYYLCKYLHWHEPNNETELLGGFQLCSTCKWCGKSILLDSQGNWF